MQAGRAGGKRAGLDSITPPEAQAWRAASIATYDDHRMAMCFSLAAFNPAGCMVRIEDPRCVGKTFPEYFETLWTVVRPRQTVPVICIDGPSASGKGTLAEAVARQLGFATLDSGALYRAAGLAARNRGIEIAPEQAQALADVARTLRLHFKEEQVWLDDQDVTLPLRTSPCTTTTRSPNSCWSEATCSSLRTSAPTPRAPSSRNRLSTARPMPEPAPVTRATSS